MTTGTSKKRMLLLELLFAVVIFAACALICALVYVRANTLALRSQELTHAVFTAESAAEAYQSVPADRLASLLGGVQQDGMLIVYYNDHWETAAEGDLRLQMTLTPLQGREAADIALYHGDRLVYRLTCHKLAEGES